MLQKSVTVICDECGLEESFTNLDRYGATMIVPTFPSTRTYLELNGWAYFAGDDLCPECSTVHADADVGDR